MCDTAESETSSPEAAYNKTLWDFVTHQRQKHRPVRIEMTYPAADYESFSCAIIPVARCSATVRRSGSTDLEAFIQAAGLFTRIGTLEEAMGKAAGAARPAFIKPLPRDDRSWQYGENINIHEDYWVYWKTREGRGDLEICGLSRRDVCGWHITDLPYDLPTYAFRLFEVEDYQQMPSGIKGPDDFHMQPLLEGEELYGYNTLSFLTGRAGLFVVKGGKVTRSICLVIS